MGGGTATYDDFYRALVTDVGNQVQTAVGYAEHQGVMVTSLENYRDSISGVSLDEEMLNLIKFQHAYDAAAKLISTVDEMIDTIMNMTQIGDGVLLIPISALHFTSLPLQRTVSTLRDTRLVRLDLEINRTPSG